MNSTLLSGSIIRTNIPKLVPAMLQTFGYMAQTYHGGSSMDIVTQKKCKTCGEWKDKSEFHKDKHSKDGLCFYCKQCNCKRVSNFQKTHREQANARTRRWSEKHPEFQSSYYKSHAQKIIEYSAKWASANPEKRREIRNKWNSQHADHKKSLTQARRCKKKNSEGLITAKEWRELKEKYNYTCLKCRRREPEIKLTLDHIVPISLGGLNVVENAQPLCGPCNSSKGAKIKDYR